MVFKFLGKGKKSEYFLEAPPATNGAEPAAKIANKVAEVADKVTDKVAEVADKVADKVTDNASASTKTESVANGATSETSETAKAKKFKKVKTAETKETTSAAPAPAAPAKPAAKPAPAAAPEVKNFATDYLMPSNMPRRRPGPSLSKFRDMARDVTPRR